MIAELHLLRGVSLEEILADVVVTNTEQTERSSPGSDDLTGQLAACILPVCAESDDTANNGETNSIANYNGVVGVLSRLLLGRFLLSSCLFSQSLGFILDLLFALYALSLRVGLDRLRLVVGRHRGDVGAVYVDERVDAVVRGVFNLWWCGGTSLFRALLGALGSHLCVRHDEERKLRSVLVCVYEDARVVESECEQQIG
jgi:hypothetical protein